MEELAPGSVLGRFDGRSFTQADRTWHFRREGERYFVELEELGRPRVRLEVAYTFGVDPLQQFLVTRPDGRLQALPVAWDARDAKEGGQRFFHLVPGESIPPDDPLHWDGLAYSWNSQCASCHSTGLVKGYDAETERFDTRWSDIDVGCEACHGSGSRHVEIQQGDGRRDASGSGFDLAFGTWDPNVWERRSGDRIARRSLPPGQDTELRVCGPCHSRRSPIVEAPEIGAPLLDGYRPRMIEPDLYFSDGQIRDEVYVWGSFVQSRMHSAGVRCSDCHDPHSLALRRSGNALCNGCHAPEAYDTAIHHGHVESHAGAACVACHMPERTYMEIDPRRDHSFPIPRPARTESLGIPNACDDCHADRGSGWAAERIAAWRGGDRSPPPHWSDRLVEAGAARSDPERWLEIALDAGQADIVRASSWLRLASDADSAPSFELLSERIREGSPLERLALVEVARRLAPAMRLALLQPLLEDPRRALRVAAAQALVEVPTQLWRPAARASFARALGEYREAQQANAERPEAQVSLGSLALQAGDSVAARAAYQRAIERAPYFVPAYVNLADLERVLGREAESVDRLREALEIAPDEVMVRHALGLALHRLGRSGEALAELEAAARAAPDQPRLVLAWALALDAGGRRDDAIEALGEAVDRRPRAGELHHALVTLLRDEGRFAPARERARAWREALPADRRAQGLLDELGDATQR